jgi:hypothetical protein
VKKTQAKLKEIEAAVSFPRETPPDAGVDQAASPTVG